MRRNCSDNRTRLYARQTFYKEGAGTTILLGIEDVTMQRILEREKDELLKDKDVLFEELQHLNELRKDEDLLAVGNPARVIRRLD